MTDLRNVTITRVVTFTPALPPGEARMLSTVAESVGLRTEPVGINRLRITGNDLVMSALLTVAVNRGVVVGEPSA